MKKQEEGGHLQAEEKRPSEETSLVSTLISDSQTPELRGNRFLLSHSCLACVWQPWQALVAGFHSP